MDHYTILGLPRPVSINAQTSRWSADNIRQAYRKALLNNHPDKAPVSLSVDELLTPSLKKIKSRTPQSSPTVDDIKLAYAVLSDPIQRTAYDRVFLLQSNPLIDRVRSDRLTGGEVIDLDDMTFNETAGDTWYRSCRCGQERGYELFEAQLDKAAAKGESEIIIGCQGCSLWIRVAFAAADG